jgi:hypothetical protein
LAHWSIAAFLIGGSGDCGICDSGICLTASSDHDPVELRTRIDRFADGVIALCHRIALDPLKIRLLVQLQSPITQ